MDIIKIMWQWCFNYWLYLPYTSTKLLCDLLRTTVKTSHFLLCGDFNYLNIYWSNLTSSSLILLDFVDTTQDLFLHQHILEPTRYRGNQTPHVLDLVFSNEEGMVSDVSYLPGLGSSDHVCICFNLNCYSERSEDKLPRLTVTCIKLIMWKWGNCLVPLISKRKLAL